jgi:hypothetical protein
LEALSNMSLRYACFTDEAFFLVKSKTVHCVIEPHKLNHLKLCNKGAYWTEILSLIFARSSVILKFDTFSLDFVHCKLILIMWNWDIYQKFGITTSSYQGNLLWSILNQYNLLYIKIVSYSVMPVAQWHRGTRIVGATELYSL